MDTDAGFLYLLMESSTEGRLKIESSEEDPVLMYGEGDSPWRLVYREYFRNALKHALEKVHEVLSESELKDGDSIFFKTEPYAVIECIQGVKSGEIPLPKRVSDISRAFVLFDEACDYYYGRGDLARDYKEALARFEEASRLGSLASYTYLGRMYEYGEGVTLNVHEALRFYQTGARAGSHVCSAKVACLYWRDSEVKDVALGQEWWERYFTDLNHDLVTKEDFANFNFYVSLARENQVEIRFQDVLGVYQEQMLRLLQVRRDVCNEQHSDNSSFREYMLSIIDEEMAFVRSLSGETTAGVRDNYGVISDYLNIENMGLILLVDIERGAFSVGDRVMVKATGGFVVETAIKKIEKFGKFAERVEAGESVGFLVDANEDDLRFVKSGATVVGAR